MFPKGVKLMSRNQLVIPNENGSWNVVREGNSRPEKVVASQKEAIAAASEMAKNDSADVIVRGEDGKVTRRISFSR